MSQRGQIRIGVVGLGLIAQSVHLPNLRTLRDQFTVTHLCDVSEDLAKALAQEQPGDVRASSDWSDVVADTNVDALLVLTPGSHGDIVLAALHAGKHVLSEKPLAYSQAEALEIASAATASGCIMQVGYMKMYDPILHRVRDEIARLGTIRVVRVTVLHPTDEVQFEHVSLHRAASVDRELIARGVAYSAERLTEALGDSTLGLKALYENVLLGSVIHDIALLRGLGFTLPSSFDFVSVDPAPDDSQPIGPPRIMAVAALPESGQLQFSWNWLPDFPEYTEEIVVIGDAGRLYLDLPGPYLPAHRARVRVVRMDGDERIDAVSFAGHRTAFVHELEAFARSIQDGAEVLSTPEGAAADIACLESMVAALGHRLALNVDGEAAAYVGLPG